MNQLYPIIRRVRRPLLPVEEPAAAPAVVAPAMAKPVLPEVPAPAAPLVPERVARKKPGRG